MRNPALSLAFVLLLSGFAHAQATWQPSMPPLVTADNTTWYQSAEPILWNGEYYYPAGAVQDIGLDFFDGFFSHKFFLLRAPPSKLTTRRFNQ